MKRAEPVKRKYVHIRKVDFSDQPFVKVPLPKSIDALLVVAHDVLDLKRKAKQVFDEDMNPIKKASELHDKQKLLISCNSPIKESDTLEYKSRLPRNVVAENMKKLPLVKHQKPEAPHPDTEKHKLIAASSYTVKENIRDSIVSVYTSMAAEKRAELPNLDALNNLSQETQYEFFEDSMHLNFISPTSNVIDTDMGKITVEYCLNVLRGVKPESIKYVINGPSQSGKTTLLHTLSTLVFKKLQVCSEADNYLIVPINWLTNYVYIDDISKLYELYVTATMNALRCCKLFLIPVIPVMLQWFLSLVKVPAFSPLPPVLLHAENFPQDLVIQIGRSIHNAWHSKHGLEQFVKLCTTFPSAIASAFALKGVMMIYDHFEFCDLMFGDVPRFPESEETVHIRKSICSALEDVSYLVSSRDDIEFFKCFTPAQFTLLSTENIVSNFSQPDIILSNPSFSLAIGDCFGCPAYCSLYQHICDLVRDLAADTTVKSTFSKLRSVVDLSRRGLIRQELVKLCLLLATNGTDVFDENTMNALISCSDFDATLQ